MPPMRAHAGSSHVLPPPSPAAAGSCRGWASAVS
uniref:Uncharacterized protein n=1 Tax=Arundo donax TaxID=35708 RepID=A0A0A8ZWG3_ARUDO